MRSNSDGGHVRNPLTQSCRERARTNESYTDGERLVVKGRSPACRENRSSLSFNYGPGKRLLQHLRNVFHCLSSPTVSVCVCVRRRRKKWTCQVDLRQSDRAVALTYFCCVQNRSRVNVLSKNIFYFQFSFQSRESHVFSFFFFIISFLS
jgi:hypothetical protein